jgi:outer membrane protein W
MKKLFILISAVTLSTSMFAQKGTTDNPFTIEGTINYTTADGFDWQAPNIRARYFFKDNMAARLQLGLGNQSLNLGGSESSSNALSVAAGFEYHLAGNDKMSPFFAAGVGYQSDMNEAAGVNTLERSGFGAGIGAGLDFYVSENIYLGVELGLLSFTTGSETVAGVENKASVFNLGGGSAIRLGWRF